MATNTLNVNALPDYIQENRDELFVKAVAGTKTLDYVEIMPNVKGKAGLNYLDSTIVLGNGESCGWNPQGEDTFSQKVIETKLVSIQKEFCWKDLRNKAANYELNIIAGRENMPFAEKIAESNVAAIKKEVEKMVWLGNETVGIEGFIPEMQSSGSAVTIVNSGETMTDKIKAVIANLSADALEKGANIFLSWTAFRTYVNEQNGACCDRIIDAAVDELVYAADSRIKLVPVAGLENTNYIVGATYDALVYATDIEDADSVYKMWYDEKEDKMLFKVLFNAGTAVKFSDEVVLWSDDVTEGGDNDEGGDDTSEGEGTGE